MSTRSYRTMFLLVLLSVCLTGSAIAEVGQIKGRVTDKTTGDPAIGVSVQIVGQTLGARTDVDGRYQILRVPVGSYTLKFTSVEYATVEIQAVTVAEGMTTEQNVALTRAVIDLSKTIEVMANADVIDKFVTENKTTVVCEAIKTKPVQNIDALLEQVRGVQTTTTGEVYIRGGRAGDVSYIVDGTEIGDPLGGLNGAGGQLQLQPGYGQMPPANGGTAIVNGQPFDAMFFKNHGVNPFVDTEDDRLSTFAVDVDDASYSMTRSYLDRGHLPPPEAVRVEEFVNHFDYAYAAPEQETFRVYMEAAPSPFGPRGSLLFRIGIKGKEISDANRKPANLVFVIDVSGSMGSENRLGTVKRSLKLLVENLRPEDSLGIVVYGSTASVCLEPTALRNRDKILNAINALRHGGSTNAEHGIRLGYEMADRMLNANRINRIILCSDGVANVGQTGPDEILKEIAQYRDKGILLTAVGFGMGNFNDVLMERLGNRGNGHYAYIDTFDEAKRLFGDNLTGTLQVIARDVKIQVDFNPDVVRSYRLLGYENRDVADDKFRDDSEDGGEIGAGHTVTALYEIKLYQSTPTNHLATVFMRWKNADNDLVTEANYPMLTTGVTSRFESASEDFRLAAVAAEFAEILRDSYWARDGQLEKVTQMAAQLERHRQSPELAEFVSLTALADSHSEELASR